MIGPIVVQVTSIGRLGSQYFLPVRIYPDCDLKPFIGTVLCFYHSRFYTDDGISRKKQNTEQHCSTCDWMNQVML
jgi:hypothetical protein